MSTRTETTTTPILTTRSIALLALAAALATSTSYAIQPELEEIADDLHAPLPTISAAAAAPILGYLIGLALLVPLVDRMRPNRLIAGQLSALAAGLLVAAAAPNTMVLGLGLLGSGICASTGAQMSTLAGKLASPERRGRAVGAVTAGISAGILLGRLVGGGLADLIGWRSMLVVLAAGVLMIALAVVATLPGAAQRSQDGYRETIASLPRLMRSSRELLVAAGSGALWFFSFSLVWVSLSISLARPPMNLSATVIGLYALAGLVGVGATRVAGVLADRFGSRRVVLGSLVLSCLCALVMSFSLEDAGVLLVALALFDAGLFSAQVANQSRVLAIDPERPARFNSAYMVVYFVGGIVGTAVGGTVVLHLGWPGAARLAGASILAAITILLIAGGRRVRSGGAVAGSSVRA